MLFKIINIILLLSITALGQTSIKWRQLAPQTQKTISDLAADSAASVVTDTADVLRAEFTAELQDSIAFPVDTLALQQLNMAEGRVACLRQLSSANIDGGGWLTVVDSSDHGSILTTATKGAEWFEHPTTDRVWVRDIYRIRRVAFAEDFGCMGDGSTDDATAIDRALTSGVQILFESGKTYNMGSQVSVADVDVIMGSTGKGKAIFSVTADIIAFVFNATAGGTTTTLKADVILGDGGMTVNNPSIFTVGDLVTIISDAAWYYGVCKKGELQIVKSIDADTVFFEMGAEDTYDVSGETVTFTVYDPPKVDIRDIKIDYSPQRDQMGMQIYRSKDVFVDNIEIVGARSTGLQLGSCYGVTVSNSIFRDNIKTGYGYGVVTAGSKNVTIKNNWFFRFKRAVDISSVSDGMPSRYFLVTENYANTRIIPALPDVDGYGTHAGAEHGKFTNNFVTGVSRSAFTIRGGDIIVDGNIVVGTSEDFSDVLGGVPGLDFYIWSSSGANHTITNNIYSSCLNSRTDQSGKYIYKNQLRYFYGCKNTTGLDSTTFLNISNNIINSIRSDIGTQGFFIAASSNDSVYNVTIKDNIVTFANHPDSTTGTGYFLQGKIAGTDAFNWDVSNNTILTHNSDFVLNLDNRITFHNSYINYTYNAMNYTTEGVTIFGKGTHTGVSGHEVQIGGKTSSTPPDLVLFSDDWIVEAGDTLSFIRSGTNKELGQVYTDFSTIRTEASDAVGAASTANGELIFSARDGTNGLIDIAKLDGNDQTFEILNLKIGDLAGGGAVIDSAYVDGDSLKFRVGGQWYKMEEAD